MKNLYLFLLLLIGVQQSYAQCTTGASLGSLAPSGTAQTVAVAAGVPAYYSFSAVAGTTYTFSYCSNGGSSSGDSYLTIANSTPTSQASNDDFCGLASQVSFTCPTTGTYRIYLSGCCPCANTPSGTLAYWSSAPTPGCTNTSPFGSSAAPVNTSITITSCQYAGEYATVTGVTASTAYTSSTDLAGGYFTVHQGTSNGPVVGYGTGPLTWTSTVAGTYYIHLNTNSACGTDASCHTNVISHTSCVAPAAPTLVSATPTSVCPGVTSNLRGTSAGNTIRWYTVASGGTNIGTSASGANFPVTPMVTTTYYAEALAPAGCVSATRTPVTVTVTAGPAAPTSVTATPATLCPGQSSNLRATSTGNTIRWYTVATGGTNIGTSASGANFAVSPMTTTTYYAEALTAGGCVSTTRTAVVVNVTTAPTAPTNVTATPATVCSGATVQLNALANSTGFTGAYAPANWTFSNGAGDNGSGSTAGAPTSISMTSSNNGSFSASSCFYTINITTSGTLNFDWSYTTTDGAAWDYPQYAINGTIIGLIGGFSGAGGSTQSGNTSIAVTAGQTFSFVMTSGDNSGGSATTTFSNFSGPANGANSVRWYTAASGGTLLGTVASGANFAVNPTATTTYYAETYTAGGCTSTSRVPVTVTVEIPATPTSVVANPAAICAGSSTDLSAISGSASAIVSGFTGVYAPANWTISHAPVTDLGTVDASGAPASISITSSNGGNSGNHSVIYTVTILGTGNVTFDWSYVTTDVDGSAYDIPQYAINGTIIGNVPGFVSGGAVAQSGSATIAVTAGQTFTLVMTALDDILGAATTVFSNFTAPAAAGNPIVWFTTPTGGTSIGTSASGANFPVTPGSTITYYAQAISALGCPSATRVPVTVTVNTYSTEPVMGSLSSSYCPNTNITLTASGGTSGSGSNIYWYTGPNGTGTLVGTGSPITVAPSATTTYYVRRQGVCNNTNDAVGTVTLKNYIYAADGTTTSTYCTDNSGWHHFYVGDDIILSIQGNLSSAGTVSVTIRDNGAYYLDPGAPALCASGVSPGEAQFEMERNWNVQHTGSLAGSYNVRYYFPPAERTNVISAAAAWMAANPACNYTYKYNPGASGWFWFKNQGSAYSAPDYDDDATFLMLSSAGAGTTPNGINYATMSGVTNFSGGTGSVILIPDPLLNTSLLSFTGHHANKVNVLDWKVPSEVNCSHYIVERSKDGVTGFEEIGRVDGHGTVNAEQVYQLLDEHPFFGLNYYRLQQVSFDGTISYSKVIAVETPKDPNTYNVFPNPTTGDVTYQCYTDNGGMVSIEVVNALGQVLRTQKYQIGAGVQNLAVDLQHLPTGSYVLRITHNNSEVRTEKVIKQ